MKTIDKGQLALSLGVGAIGLFFLVGSWQIPDAAGYSTVGPAIVPRVVGLVLLVLAGFLVYEVWRGGYRNLDEPAERALGMDWSAFAWISGGLIAYGLVIEGMGFIIASVLLFLATARGFGSRRWLSNTLIAVFMAIIIFAMFNYGLGLSLPKGIFKGIL